MKKNQLQEGLIAENFAGIGTVTREMVLARARELAIINGHSPDHVLESEFEQAKRELKSFSLVIRIRKELCSAWVGNRASP